MVVSTRVVPSQARGGALSPATSVNRKELGARLYQSGFGNEFESEAIQGALPTGQNSPQQPPLGLISELVSGTTFSAPRALNRRTYMFRINPSTLQGRFRRIECGDFLTPPFEGDLDPNDYAWGQFQIPPEAADFIAGMHTLCGNGSPKSQSGMSIHVYLATESMTDRVFVNADGEMIIIPQLGGLRIETELGILDIDAGEFALIPKGIKLRVELIGAKARGFVCENYGTPFRLPELGLIGSNGLANAADFQAPVAAFEDRRGPMQIVRKYGGNLWAADMAHSPLDVVAWRGNLTPYKYDMSRFVALGTATIDHPDPSIYCALTSPSDQIAGPNAELMVMPPRWNVAEHSLRAPGFHQNCVAEFAAFMPSPDGPVAIGSCLHNNWVPHGPSTAAFESARVAALEPERINAGPVVMVESRFPVTLTSFATSAPELRADYAERWHGFVRHFPEG